MISLRQLAGICGVSQSTVSRALKGDSRISAQVVRQVREQAARHHYTPSRVAQGIFRGRIKAVALIASDTSLEPISREARVIQQMLLEEGYSTFFYSTGNDPLREMACFHEAVAHRVSGVIIHPSNFSPDENHFHELRRHSIPFLLLGTFGSHLGIPFVHNDDIGMGIDVVRHLCGLGHRVIAHLSGPAETRRTSQRFKGYKIGLAKHGLPHDPSLVRGTGWTAEDAYAAVQELLRGRPDITAIFAANDQLACGILRAARALSLRVPDDLSLVGAGDFSYGDLLDPPLTTVRQHPEEHGRMAVRLLLKLIDEGFDPSSGDPVPEIVIPTHLLVRGSTAAPRRARLLPGFRKRS